MIRKPYETNTHNHPPPPASASRRQPLAGYDCDTEANMAYRDGSLRDLKPEQFNFFGPRKVQSLAKGACLKIFLSLFGKISLICR